MTRVIRTMACGKNKELAGSHWRSATPAYCGNKHSKLQPTVGQPSRTTAFVTETLPIRLVRQKKTSISSNRHYLMPWQGSRRYSRSTRKTRTRKASSPRAYQVDWRISRARHDLAQFHSRAGPLTSGLMVPYPGRKQRHGTCTGAG